MPRKSVSVFVAALFLAVLPAAAQTVEGSISGTVVDQSGSVKAASSIEIVNQSTHLKRTAVTSGIGTFTVPLLPLGILHGLGCQGGLREIDQEGRPGSRELERHSRFHAGPGLGSAVRRD